MSSKNINIDFKNIGPQLIGMTKNLAQRLGQYSGLLFFLLVSCVYGFVLVRISTLSNIQPGSADVGAQASSTTIPKVDPKIANQLEALKDNSVNVQTLFERARDNPFQE